MKKYLYGARFKEVRNSKSATLQQTADFLGIRIQTYQKYENNTLVPPLPKVIKLAEFFDVSIDYLVGIIPNELRRIYKDEGGTDKQ